MTLEGTRRASPEGKPEMIVDGLIERIGTVFIPFCFRTANDSVYVTDRKMRTVRYRAASKVFQPPSNITAFLDPKYLDPTQTDRYGSEYLPNSLMHENGYLVLDDETLIREGKAHIASFDDLPQSMDVADIEQALCIAVYSPLEKKVVRKTPISLMPREGLHPIEFCDPRTNPYGHRNHLGNIIENLHNTHKQGESEVRRAIRELAEISLRNKG